MNGCAHMRAAASLGMALAAATMAAALPAPARNASPKPAAPVRISSPQPVIAAKEVLRVADAVARSLATSGRIPAGEVVTLSDGRTRSLSAAQLFVLLARFLGTGYEQGVSPQHAPAPPDIIGPLEASPATVGTSRQAIIETADLLAQTRATADVAESTGNLPSAVWVQGLRLTPAQFMGAMATVLQHALLQGAVPRQVVVGNYAAPLDWSAVPSAAGAPAAESQGPIAEAGAGPAEAPSWARLPAEVADSARSVEPRAQPTEPRLTVYVPVKPPLSGRHTLTIQYQGPPAIIRLSIGGRAKAVSNMTHFTYVWDTRLEPDGTHALRVAAVDDAERALSTVEANIETANGNLPLR